MVATNQMKYAQKIFAEYREECGNAQTNLCVLSKKRFAVDLGRLVARTIDSTIQNFAKNFVRRLTWNTTAQNFRR